MPHVYLKLEKMQLFSLNVNVKETILCFFIILSVLLYYDFSTQFFIFRPTYHITQKPHRNITIKTSDKIECDKWVVITTINSPTWHVMYIQDSLYDWCVVVVADKQTPVQWSYKNVVFLSVERQRLMSLEYEIIHKIPYNSYLRKIIGYLYAIKHGAKYIYDTDDDNSPLDALLGFRYRTFKGLVCYSNEKFINPYSHFGQASVWPRGYPLSKISDSYKCKSYKIYSDSKEVPIIQQGLVNGLSRKHNAERMDLKFDPNAPPLVLASSQYAPLSSLNILFHYNAFWSLVLPLSIRFREFDVYRGYLSIRLVREIAGHIAFVPPNNMEIQNSHIHFDDIQVEKRFYNNVESLVKELDVWRCSNNTFEECFIDCIEYLARMSILNKTEIDFYKSWIRDLTTLGYKWPKLKKVQDIKSDQTKSDVFFKAKEQLQSPNADSSVMKKHTGIEVISKKCELKERIIKPCKIENIVIITEANSIQDLKSIESTVGSHFPYLAICYVRNRQDALAYSNNTSLSIIIQTNFESCVDDIMKMGYKQQSFIIAKNIAAFEFWRIDRESVQFESLTEDKNIDYNEDIIFQRNTVANGKRKLRIRGNANSLTTLCDVYKAEKEQELCASILNTLETLNWHKNDMASESCENIASYQIWIPDLHDGPRVDITSVLAHLGQTPVVSGNKLDKSPFPHALALGKVSRQLSKYIKIKKGHSSIVSEYDIKENFNYYKSSSDFAATDAVICSFPATMCEAFMPLNVTVIINPAHRYNLGRCTLEKWTKYNENIHKLYSNSKLAVSSMSRYDGEYLRQFTGLRGYKLYAFGGYYAKGVKYNPIKREILIGPTNNLGGNGEENAKELNKYSGPLGVKFVKIRSLYSRYTLQDLANHPAIVLFPYAVMSYSINDFYISSIPIFIPSIELLTKWRSVYDRAAYCDDVTYLSLEMLVNATYDIPHKYNPNSDANDDYSYWLQYADYYQWPFVTVFNSWEDLVFKIKTLNLMEISENMGKFNLAREGMLLDNWCRLLKNLTKPVIPKSYEDILKYYKMTRFTA